MPYLFVILFKINLVLIVFAATYYLILRKLTFYAINRIFLIFGIVFSSAYPFIDLSGLFNRYEEVRALAPQIDQKVSQLIQQDSISAFWQVAITLFYAGAFAMAAKLAVQFISLYRIHKRSDPGFAGNYKIRVLKDELGPFSFWQTIYVNPLLHEEQDLENILKHEKVHIDEWHTLDITLAEVCVVFYWFNPGVWLMKRAVRENLEFLTDERILRKGVDKKTYQYSLINAGQLVPTALVNNFNLSDLKKRIRMMNAKPSSPLALSRYLFIIPALLITTLAFTINRKNDPIRKTSPEKEAILNKKPPVTAAKAEHTVRTIEYNDTRPPKTGIKREKTTKFKIVRALRLNTDSLDGTPSLLPGQLAPGDRIKILALREDIGTQGAGGSLFFADSAAHIPANAFYMLRKKGSDPDNANPGETHFFLNGKEVTREEFEKVETRELDGFGLDKKHVIHIIKRREPGREQEILREQGIKSKE